MNAGALATGLVVDACNPTGAIRLYEKVGMHVGSEYVVYEKEHRPGRGHEQCS